ncbi:MAG: aminotransferase class I/II-fold pyridoxal phosphate-dependent enzyme [Christensenellales bacterium]|jgi:cystathionine beta-lyase family protein involved in aluminum resistance
MDRSQAYLLVKQAEEEAANTFKSIEEIALYNQDKVLEAFTKCKVASRHFNPSSGYGYDDASRRMLGEVFAKCFKTEDALVSPLISGGTGALCLSLFGILRPGDTMLSITGKPYDTLTSVIGGENIGSLKDFGVKYHEIPLSNGNFDYNAISSYLSANDVKLIYIQRSRGYEWRRALSITQIAEVCSFVKKIAPNSVILCDNCYGEFTSHYEPCEVGADIIIGSLIKNPGGGLAPTGGYAAGSQKYINLLANRLTAPSVGRAVGSYAASYRPYYQGLFMAPSTVGYALKGNVLASIIFNRLGYQVLPEPNEIPLDIICSIGFDTKEQLIAFCRSVQYASPVDGFVTACAGPMPGYSHEVIMAAGTFVQGGSLELTADAPIREPYIAYLQGGLTYEHIKLALIKILEAL